jgi:Cu/Ag efflux protein CusF
MKKALLVGLVVLFCGMGLIATAFAQGADTAQTAQAIAKGKAGSFKGEVVKTDPAAKTITVKLAKGEKTGDTTYASFNGAFNAAQDLKPGDKIAGHWSEVKGKIYVTYIVKMD